MQAVVSGHRVCRPAPDLRLHFTATPDANRVGGTFSYEVVVRNAGRRGAPRTMLVADAPADAVSATTVPARARLRRASCHPIQLTFTDNGDPGVGKDMQATYPAIENASPCPVPLFADRQDEIPLIDGNYVVRDVQP